MIETTILANLINNNRYQTQVITILDSEYFEDYGTKEIFKIISNYIDTYNNNPSLDAIVLEVTKLKVNDSIYESIIDCLQEIKDYSDEPDNNWLLDQTQQWVTDRATHLALYKCIDILENKKDEMNNIPEILRNAVSIQIDNDLGIDYYDDAEEHYKTFYQEMNRTPFDIELFNKCTKGGVPRKTLNIIQAGVNVGKTTALIHLAIMYLKQGLNVYYYTFEVSDSVIKHRADVNNFETTFDKLERKTLNEYMMKINEMRSKTDGKFIIKEFPSGGASATHVENHIKEVKLLHKCLPDVLLFDYIGEMASASLPASAMLNSNNYYGSIAREVRSLAVRYNAITWSGGQVNRKSQDATDNISLSDTSDAINLVKIADLVIALLQPDDMAAMNEAIAIVNKNRYNNKSKMKKFVVGLDNDRQRFFDVDKRSQEGVMSESDKAYDERIKGTSPLDNNLKKGWT